MEIEKTSRDARPALLQRHGRHDLRNPASLDGGRPPE